MAQSETDIGVSGVYPPTPFGFGPGVASFRHEGFDPAEVGLFTQQGLSDSRHDITTQVSDVVRQTNDTESLRQEIRRAADVSAAAAVPACPAEPARPLAQDAEVMRLRSELQRTQQQLFQQELAKTIGDAIRDALNGAS